MALFAGVEIPGHPDLDNIRKLDLLAIPFIRRAQRLGIAIDPPYFADLSSKFAGEIKELERDIFNYIPPEKLSEFTGRTIEGDEDEEIGSDEIYPHSGFNASSPEQIGKLLFEILGIGLGRKLKRTAKGAISTGKKSLELVKNEHEIVPKILRHRELTKLKTTYCDKLPRLARYHPMGYCQICELTHRSESWRVHGEMGTTRADTGRINHKNPNCFSGDTEVLTESGWISFDSYNTNDPIAQINDGLQITFVKPTGFIRQWAERMIWNHTDEQIDLLTTEDHRCLLANRRSGNWFIYPAINYPEDYKQWNSGFYEGSGSDLSDFELAFLIAAQADGSWTSSRSLDFSFTKPRKVKRFKNILEGLGLDCPAKEDGRRSRFYIGRERYPAFLDGMWQLLSNQHKLLPWSVMLALNKSQAKFVMTELMFWDGDWTSKNRYASKHKHNADVVATLFALNGHRAVAKSCTNQVGCEFWSANISKLGYSLTSNRIRETVEWQNLCYCVSVPSSYLLVRRNGKIHVTGNCGNIPTRTEDGQDVQRGFIAPPGCKLVASDLKGIEMRDLAHLSRAYKSMIKVFLEGGDPHDDTSRRAFNLRPDEKPDKIKHRMAAKRVNFGIQNGTTNKGLFMQLVMDYGANKLPIPDWLTEDWCQWFIDKWLESYPEVREYFDLCHYRARRYGMAWDIFGRVRLIPEVRSTHSWIREAGLRYSQNLPVTSTAAGQLKLAMGRTEQLLLQLYSAGVWCWPLLTIHDAEMVECDEDAAEDVKELLTYAMNSCMIDEDTGEHRFRVPIGSDAEIMERWVK